MPAIVPDQWTGWGWRTTGIMVEIKQFTTLLLLGSTVVVYTCTEREGGGGCTGIWLIIFCTMMFAVTTQD